MNNNIPKKVARLSLPAAVILFFAQSLLGQSAASAPGYDVVLLVGQSNMVGVGTGTDDAGDASVDPRILQWQPYTQTMIPAFDPIYQNQALDNIGLAMTFAKAYAKRMTPGRQLLLVGAATGGTGFSSGYWQEPNGSGVTTALSWVNAAMAAAGPNAKLVGILWHQGEADIYSDGGPAYAANLSNLITYFRSNIAGASSTTPFVAGEMAYAWLTSNLTTSDYVTQQDLILNDIHSLPDTMSYTAWTSAAELVSDLIYGPVHFSALSYRQLGRRYADKFFEAQNNLPQPQVSQKWWAGTFYDDGCGLGTANTNTIPVNNPPTVSGTVNAAIDPVRGNVAQISQGQGSLNFQVPGTTFNASYSKMAWFLPGATGYTNNLVSASNSGQIHFLFAQTVSSGSLLVAAGHSAASPTPIVQAQVSNPAGTWINVAVTYDSVAQVMTLYVNGAAVATQANVAAAPAANSTTQSLIMGGIGATGTTGLDGEMTGNRAWTSVLTAAQVAAIYNFELPGTANQPGFGIVAGVPSEWSTYGVPYQVPSISMAAASGSTASVPIAVVSNNGFAGTVNLAISGLPAGLSATFATSKTTNSYTLQFSAGSSLTPGVYPLVITGTSANSVTAQAAFTLTVVNTAGEIPVSLTTSFNHPDTFTTDGTSFTAGSADGEGYAYSANLLGTTVVSPNAQFTLGPPNAANSVSNATVPLPAGNFSSIALLGTGMGNLTGQTFTVTYTDGTTSVFTQSLSNWCTPQQYAGEAIAAALPYRNYDNGTQQSLNCFLYSYSFQLNSAKIAQSITLPSNTGVLILGITVTGTLSSNPSFALSTSPASLTVIPGGSASSMITVTPMNGFAGTVALTASGLPSGVTASFSSGSVAGTSTLNLSASSAAAAGVSNISVVGTSGTLTISTPISVTVTQANVTEVSLASGFNLNGITSDGSTVTNGGLDTSSYAYSATLLGTSLTFQGIPYVFGAAGSANAASSTTLALPAGSYGTLNFLGTAVYGNQASQTFTVTYSDGTTSTFTQSMSDWGSPQSYSGETIASTMSYRVTPTGGQQAGLWYLYTYSFALNSAKKVKSFTLPNNRSVAVLAVTMSGSVSNSAQTITFGAIAAQTVGTPLTLSATASSGLAVSYTSSTTSVCTVSGSTATFLAAGTCTITASQAGNSSYAAATPVSQSITVNAALKSQTITFGSIAAQTVGTPLTLSASASSGLTVSYASSTTSVCTVSGSTATFIAAGTCTITASQAGNSSYAAATPVSQSITVNAALKSQTITFGSIAAQTVGTPLTLTAIATSGLAVSYASSTTSVCTVSGSTATFIAAGTCTITASQAGNSSYAAATAVSQSFTVQAATTSSTNTTVSLGSSANVYGIFNNGSSVTNGGLDTSSYAYSANLLGTSLTFQGIPYTFGTAGSADAVTSAMLTLPSGSYSTLNFLGAAVSGNQASATFTVTYTDGTTSTFKQGMSDWGSPQSYTGESKASSMSYRVTPSGGQQTGPWYLYAYSFTLNSAKTVKSFTLPNSRNVVVLAVTLSGSAGKTAQTITFGSIATQTAGKTLALTATASSGLAVSYASSTASICTVSGSTATFLTAGTCTITASQVGNSTYAAATSVTQNIIINATLKSQTITFSAAAAQTVGTPLTLAATASSGLAVSYASSTTSICTVSGSTATFLTAGTCTITASQAGNSTYAAATSVSQSFTVLSPQTITFGTISAQTAGTTLALTASASSGLAISYTASPSSVCTVSASTASFVAAGTCAITASQAGNATYAAATPVSQSFTVQAAPTSTTTTVNLATAASIYGIFNNGSTVTNGGLDGSGYAYSATLLGTSLVFQSLPYSFGTPGSADAVSSTTLTLPAGNFTTLGFLGTAVFGNQTSQTFVVTYTDGTTATFTQSMSDWGSPQSYSGESIATTMAYRLTPAGAQQSYPFNLYSYSFALNSAKVVKSFTLPNSRSVVVLAVTLRSGNTTPQTITFNPITTQTVNTSLPLTGATASSGLAVSYSSTTTSVCTVSNTTALLLSDGTCSITASQTGNTTYAPATPVSQSFTVQAPSVAYTTICQAQQNSGSASYCSDQMPGPASGGYNSLPSWVNLGKTLSSISVSDDQVWGLDASGTLWFLPNFKTSVNWTQMATGVVQISAGHSLVCQINTNTHLLCGAPPTLQNPTVNWVDAGTTSYTRVAVSAGTKLWVVDSSNNLSAIKDYTHASTTTTLVAPNVQSVAADGRGLLCQTDLSNNLNCSGWPVLPSTPNSSGYYNLTNWVSVGIQLQNIAAADNKVYGTDSSGNVWLLPDYTNSSTWEEIANGGVNDKLAAASLPSSFQPGAFAPGEVAVMIFMGQSNATGISSWPARFLAPASPNIWSVTNQGWNYLAGNNNGTTPFTNPISSINAIQWSNFLVSPTTASDMNLGFNTGTDGSAANFAAYQWQAMIDAGAQLPDLYIIHIGWASEGVDANDGGPSTSATWLVHGTSLWQPLLTNSQEPSYALAPFSRRILNIALSNLIASGKTPRIVGLQWNQWEAEADSGNPASITDAPANYSNLFNGFFNAIGSHFPVQVVKPLSTAYGAANLSAMQTVFANLVTADPTDYSVLDISQVSSTIFSGGVLGGGDGSVHYNLDTQQWFANQAIGACLTYSNCGTRITTVSSTPTN